MSSELNEPTAPPATSMGQIITVQPGDAEWISTMLVGAASRWERVRFAIDEGGVKIAVGRGTWTPAIGKEAR